MWSGILFCNVVWESMQRVFFTTWHCGKRSCIINTKLGWTVEGNNLKYLTSGKLPSTVHWKKVFKCFHRQILGNVSSSSSFHLVQKELLAARHWKWATRKHQHLRSYFQLPKVSLGLLLLSCAEVSTFICTLFRFTRLWCSSRNNNQREYTDFKHYSLWKVCLQCCYISSQ